MFGVYDSFWSTLLIGDLEDGFMDDFKDLSWLYTLLGLFCLCMHVITHSEHHDLPENLTDYTWHLSDNYIVPVTIVAGKILLHGNKISCYTCYMSCYTDILFTDIIYSEFMVAFDRLYLLVT